MKTPKGFIKDGKKFYRIPSDQSFNNLPNGFKVLERNNQLVHSCTPIRKSGKEGPIIAHFQLRPSGEFIQDLTGFYILHEVTREYAKQLNHYRNEQECK